MCGEIFDHLIVGMGTYQEIVIVQNILMPLLCNGDSAASTHLLNTLSANENLSGTALYS